MYRSARRSIARVAGLVGAVAIAGAVSVTPASARPVTVPSPVKAVPGSVDLRTATVDYDRTQGRLDVTLTMRGPVGVGRGKGPTYSVLLYGPRNLTGGQGQAVVSIVLSGPPIQNGLPVPKGRPFTGPLIFNPVGTAENQLVQIPMRYAGNRVEFRARDDLLKNLPLQYFDVQTSLDGIYVASDVRTTDTLRGALPTDARPAPPAR